MSPAEVDEHRKQLDGIKVRGKDVPKPVKNWNQVGLGGALRGGGHAASPSRLQGEHVKLGAA